MNMPCDELKRLTQSIVPFLYIKLNTESFRCVALTRHMPEAGAVKGKYERIYLMCVDICLVTEKSLNQHRGDAVDGSVSLFKKFF